MQPHSPDLSNFEHSRTTLVILGWGMIVLGAIASFVITLGVIHGNADASSVADQAQVIVLGSLGCMSVGGAVGVTLFSIRRRVWIDLVGGALGTESRVLGRSWHRELPLMPTGRVVFAERLIPSSEGDWTVWAVDYVCEAGALELHRLRSAVEGRAWAERFASYLGMPLNDEIEGTQTWYGEASTGAHRRR